jgi:hypothetical protein
VLFFQLITKVYKDIKDKVCNYLRGAYLSKYNKPIYLIGKRMYNGIINICG